MKNIALIPALFIYFSFFSQITEKVFYPSKDVSLGYHDNFSTENTNYGWAYQFAGYVINGALGGINSNRALTAFDLSSIPVGTVIDSARLSFYSFHDYSPSFPLYYGHYGNNACYLKKVVSAWEENQVTWNSQPQTTDVDGIVLPQSTSAYQDYLNLDVTASVQFFINSPNENFGYKFGLVDESLGNNLSFHSRESQDAAKRPVLKVYYRSPVANIQEEKSLKVTCYPNPVKDFLKISNEGEFNQYQIKDVSGAIVKEMLLEEGLTEIEINVSMLNKGLYFLELKNEAGILMSLNFIKN